MDPQLKIVIVDENPIRAAILEEGLREAGHVQVVRIEDTTRLLARVYAIDVGSGKKGTEQRARSKERGAGKTPTENSRPRKTP